MTFTKLQNDFISYGDGDLYLLFERANDGSVTVHEDCYRTGGGVTYDPYVGASDDKLTDICNRAVTILNPSKSTVMVRFSYEDKVSVETPIHLGVDIDLSNNKTRTRLLNRLLKSNSNITEVTILSSTK